MSEPSLLTRPNTDSPLCVLGYFKLRLTGCAMLGKKDCVFTCDPAACLFLISLLELFHAGRGGCVEGFIAGRLPHDADSRVHLGCSEGFRQPSSHSVSVERSE